MPPAPPAPGASGPAAEREPAVSVRLDRLKHRPDFLLAAQARRQGTGGFLLQARERRAGEGDPATIRVGFTCSKKVGNSVTRNRARRRLREVARALLPVAGRPGWDYVLVGRPEATVSRDFARLREDLAMALAAVHRPRAPKPAPDAGGAP